MFGCHGKYHFPENDFRLTNIFTFDPEMIFRPHFHFKSFPEKERERRESPDQRERKRRESPDRAAHLTIAPCRQAARSMRSRSAIVDRAARSSIEQRDRRSSSAIDDLVPRLSSDDRTARRLPAKSLLPFSLSDLGSLFSFLSLSLSLSLFFRK